MFDGGLLLQMPFRAKFFYCPWYPAFHLSGSTRDGHDGPGWGHPPIQMNALISACGNGQCSGFSKGKMWECGFLTIWTLRDGQHALLEPELDKPGARDFNVKPEENAVLSYSLSLSQFSILLVAGVPFLSKHASPSCIEPPSIMITQLFSESLFYLHIFCGMMSIISIVVWRRSKTALCTLQCRCLVSETIFYPPTQFATSSRLGGSCCCA